MLELQSRPEPYALLFIRWLLVPSINIFKYVFFVCIFNTDQVLFSSFPFLIFVFIILSTVPPSRTLRRLGYFEFRCTPILGFSGAGGRQYT